MDIKAHQEIADANRSFYEKFPEELVEFRKFTDTSLVNKYIAENIAFCTQWMNESNTRPIDERLFLDLGTGTGQMIHHLVKHVSQKNIHAIDIAEENIRIARESFEDVHFFLGDFILDFEPECQYDFISAYSVLHHFHDWQGVLEKMDRCLRPGGVIYVDHEPLEGALGSLIKTLMRLRHRKNRDYTRCEYHQFFDHIDLSRLKELLTTKFDLRIIYNNFGVLAPLMVRTGLDFSWVMPRQLVVDKEYKKNLRHVFANYGLIAKKL